MIELTTDKEEVKYAIDMVDSSGGTNLHGGMMEALDEVILNGDENHLRFVIFLTDGNGTWYDSAIDYANEHNIMIYTIGLGEGVDQALLERIANSTGGKYFFADNAAQLDEIFDQTAEGTIDYTTDTDGDGIPDYFEKQGMRLGNGKMVYTDYTNPDTDGDGLLDGEEVTMHYIPYNGGYFISHSDPTLIDTDFFRFSTPFFGFSFWLFFFGWCLITCFKVSGINRDCVICDIAFFDRLKNDLFQFFF